MRPLKRSSKAGPTQNRSSVAEQDDGEVDGQHGICEQWVRQVLDHGQEPDEKLLGVGLRVFAGTTCQALG